MESSKEGPRIMVTEFVWRENDLVFTYEGVEWVITSPSEKEVDDLLTRGILGRAYPTKPFKTAITACNVNIESVNSFSASGVGLLPPYYNY